ncbi:hypothetical protein [Mesorhizobium salmacidum]|uniref:Uncharacterized protein n=1 Tax=Mesorhizobium salmacidum TaxID=3015171 RepID=A0ABU8L6A2_9HYPH
MTKGDCYGWRGLDAKKLRDLELKAESEEFAAGKEPRTPTTLEAVDMKSGAGLSML